MVSHHNAINFLLSMQDKLRSDSFYAFAPQQPIWLAVTTLSFDISVLELYLPLITGAELLVASRELAIDGRGLAEFIEREQVTVLQATPATWRLLLEADWAGDGRVKALVGGEALPADILPRLLPKVDSLWNMYGPTETTVWSTCQQITDPLASISIGKPIANTQVYILDEKGQLCPQGAPGELCIAGDGVSKGYTNRADLNASQFLPDPYSDKSDARLYRTGDLARWREDGCLSYISRLDNLVKLNGYRIELGEIEAVMASHTAVKQTAVLIREDAPGIKRLVGYWVAADSTTDKADEIDFQAHLASTLPSYMIPQQYVRLEAMPQTPNGKLDRKALPEPPQRTASHDGQDLETAMQRQVAEQWQQLLAVEQLGASDNFFSMGGHSLAAIKFINWAERTHNTSVPMRSLIMGSLAQVAVHLDPESATSSDLTELDSSQLPDISIEFIDHDKGQLFATHIKNNQHNQQALLILSSHGHEQSRIDRSYRQLAESLAHKHVHCMRVDLSGMGNASMQSTEVSSLEQWRCDIRRASQSLLESSGCQSLSVLAGRFAATLLNGELFEGIPMQHAFMWDPALNGADWWQQRLDLQQRMTNSSFYFLKPGRLRDPQGLLSPGFSLCTSLRKEIDAIALEPTSLDNRFHVIVGAESDTISLGEAKVIATDDKLSWNDTFGSTSTDIDSEGMRQYVFSTLIQEGQ
ncbi:MAG: AMP-binding protein, partial [Granulosicoccaceae bacterium]